MQDSLYSHNKEEEITMANAFKMVAPITGIVLLRRKELGNNCHNIADNYADDKMQIVLPDSPLLATAKFIIRWGTTAKLPESKIKQTVFNTAEAIIETSRKGPFRLKVHIASKGKLTPRTWATVDDLAKEEEVGSVIVRPTHHERSKDIFLCTNLKELEAAIAKCKEGYYISEYIKKDEEYRVFVAQGRAFMVFRKKPKDKNAVSWGCVEEGALEYVAWSDWPLEVVRNAIGSFLESRLDFGAVDVMVKDGKAYFLEINTAPEVWKYYGERFSDIFGYMVKNGKERLLIKDNKNWKGLIHPAITDKAVV
jgi:hypothetical protein